MSAMQLPLEPWIQEMQDNWVLTASQAAHLQLQWELTPAGTFVQMPHDPMAASRINLYLREPGNSLPL
jgi:hypothetical protein